MNQVELVRLRRKWLFMAWVFPAFWLIDPFGFVSALAVWLWLGVLWLFMADQFPRRLVRWICSS